MSRAKIKVYLCGPMTGEPQFNYPLFNQTAAEWRKAGYEVFNPAEVFGGDPTRDKADYLRADIIGLATCEALVLIPGWHKRKESFCHVEHLLARELGMTIYDASKGIGISYEKI